MPTTDLASMLASGDRDALPEGDLAVWVQRQRWFGSKARDVGIRFLLDTYIGGESQGDGVEVNLVQANAMRDRACTAGLDDA